MLSLKRSMGRGKNAEDIFSGVATLLRIVDLVAMLIHATTTYHVILNLYTQNCHFRALGKCC
jgi:hypothetical protein